VVETAPGSARIDLPLDRIREICLRFPVRELSIFGSALRADFRPDSDLDLLVEFQPDARVGFIELGVLEEEPERLFGSKVDLITKRSVRPELRREIIGSARVLYEAA
jgi:predicted nucleotidyltransferase